MHDQEPADEADVIGEHQLKWMSSGSGGESSSELCTELLASFPGHSHCQYFIDSSMKYGGEGLGDLVTSDDVR